MKHTRLYVGDLASNVTHEQVLDLFTQAGEVQSVELIALPPQGSFAFVEMVSPEAAHTAVTNYNGYELSGHKLIVYSVPQRSHPRNVNIDK